MSDLKPGDVVVDPNGNRYLVTGANAVETYGKMVPYPYCEGDRRVGRVTTIDKRWRKEVST